MGSRRLKRKVKKLLIVLLLVLIAAGGFGGYKLYEKIKASRNNNQPNEVEPEPEPPKEVWPKVYKASLVATGDGLLHNTLVNDAHDVATDTYDFTNETSMINDIISKYDIAYYNQETIFGGKQEKRFNCKNMPRGYCSYPTFNSPSEFGDAMIKAGFNVVSLASNHTADCTYASKDCLTNAYNYWSEKAETEHIVFDGLNIDETKENKYNIGEVNGIKYGFLNYTNTLNGLDGSIKNFPYMVDQYSEEVVDKEVAELKEKVDVVIVAMHWHKDSAEYELNPTKANKAIAQHLADIGVNIVLGTYSHCLQPFDVLDNGTVVFYSLGNFISNQGVLSKPGYLYGGISKGVIGVLASMDITKTVNEDGTQEIKVDNLGADLLYTYNNSSYRDYKAIPFSKMNSTYNKNYVSIYEKYTEVLTRLNKNITIAPYPGMPEKVETPEEMTTNETIPVEQT